MRRIFLFLLTNIAVLVVLSVVVRLLGLDRALAANGLDVGGLLVFSAVVGFTGAIISLLLSKPMAKWSTGAQVIETPKNENEAWLLATVKRLADKAGVGMPEVSIYEGEPNAFATGAFRNSALVAVSTGLLSSMSREEIEAVLGHELSHVANGDMVTLTLIQGVVNTFVVFLSRVVAFFVDRIIFRTERGSGPGYFITMIVAQIVLGVLASMIVAWFSRRREFPRRRRQCARLLGTPQPMMHALARLGGLPPGELPKSMTGFGITDHSGFMALFATHPPIEERIRALQAGASGPDLAGATMATPLKYKIEIEAPNGIWSDVRGADGAILTFDSEAEARTRLLELYPVETRMEGYGGGKRTRVIRILPDDEDDWPKRGAPK